MRACDVLHINRALIVREGKHFTTHALVFSDGVLVFAKAYIMFMRDWYIRIYIYWGLALGYLIILRCHACWQQQKNAT